jgi:hypothetical protein
VMQVADTYTDDTLAEFVSIEVGECASVLGWDVRHYRHVIRAALRVYGASTVAAATDTAKLELLARVAAWEYVVRGFTSFYTWSDPGGSNSQSDLQRNALVALASARRDAVIYLPSYTIAVSTIVYDDDPYAADDDSEYEA